MSISSLRWLRIAVLVLLPPSQITRTPPVGQVVCVEIVLIEVTIGASLVCGFGGAAALRLFGGALLTYKDRGQGLELVQSGCSDCRDAKLPTVPAFDVGPCL